MRKIIPVKKQDGTPDYIFFCPGCECGHGVWVTLHNESNAVWAWNGSEFKPTFTPSILIHSAKNGQPTVCHSFVREGFIEFLNDCTHKLAGRTVELPDMQ